MAEEYDPVIDDIRETLREISTEMTEARANYERACMDGDDVARRTALRQLGAYQTEYANAINYGNQYWASKQPPPQPPQPSAEERKARSWDRMDWNDVVELTRTSRYAKDIRPDDPNMIAGYHEAMRRRRAGE